MVLDGTPQASRHGQMRRLKGRSGGFRAHRLVDRAGGELLARAVPSQRVHLLLVAEVLLGLTAAWPIDHGADARREPAPGRPRDGWEQRTPRQSLTADATCTRGICPHSPRVCNNTLYYAHTLCNITVWGRASACMGPSGRQAWAGAEAGLQGNQPENRPARPV